MIFNIHEFFTETFAQMLKPQFLSSNQIFSFVKKLAIYFYFSNFVQL